MVEQTIGDSSRVYLCAPINALVEGIYEERIPFTEIKKHGDFGLGTFDQLDGEMVMLDGKIYQITSDGETTQVEETALTPFACVTFFDALTYDETDQLTNNSEFTAWLTSLLPSPNLFYAIRIEGTFSFMKVRSVPKQECYLPLVEVTKHQPVFAFEKVEGTLAGFFTPSFMSSLSVPGFHLHFLSKDLRRGGHLLECIPQKVRAGIQILRTLEVGFPVSLGYLTLDFKRDIVQDLNKAEK